MRLLICEDDWRWGVEGGRGISKVEWTDEAESSTAEFLAAGEAGNVTTLKERSFDISEVSAERGGGT